MWRRRKSKQAPVPDDFDGSSAVTSPGPSDLERRQSTGTIETARDRGHLAPERRQSEYNDVAAVQRLPILSSPPTYRSSPTFGSQLSPDQRDDPLGLTVLHNPAVEQRSVDIVFIHGLGGTSRRTWCKNRDLSYLWPKLWLPEEADLSTARILTFGYHAQWSTKRQQSSLTIGDFATDLLYSMKYGEEGSEEMGQVPIIVVAHSLGGLVFKKAFIHGNNSGEYRKLMSSIKAVLFLATPHRGTDLAKTLNKILSTSVFGHSPKDYVSELVRNSPTIDELNDSFRHHAEKLQIFSFYETLATQLGPKTVMILEKDSSLLGYRNETTQALIANHIEATKYSSPDDPNYRAVRGALRNVANMFRFPKGKDSGVEKDLKSLRKWLGVAGPPEDDMAALRAAMKQGTCERILEMPTFQKWLQSQGPQILWAHAPPGSGKSIACSFVIDHLKELQQRCVYWFFKFDDTQKRSLANMLRSAAYQIATEEGRFRRALVELAKSGTQIDKSDATVVWRVIFSSKLSLIDSELYWVVDGLDESESSQRFVNLLSNIGEFDCNIRVFLAGRPLSPIIQSIQKARKKVTITEIALADNLEDIRTVATDEMEFFQASEEFKQGIIDEITTRSHGNFLWARLVLKRVVRCYRQEEIKRVLRSTPDGMDKLYHRMAVTIAELDEDADRKLCKVFLSWAMYSKRPIGIEELSEPYSKDLETIFNLEHTITQICGQFVVINGNRQIVLVHHTAREYLSSSDKLPFSLDSAEVNEELLFQCLNALCDQHLKRKIKQDKTPPFLSYAALSWAFHLDRSSVESDRVLSILVKFFNGAYPLPWISFLAMIGQLSQLVAVSSSLNNFVRKRRKADDLKEPPVRCVQEMSLLETWALDLLKMTAKFGSHMIDTPDSIYKYIPALSPRSSMLHQKYAAGSQAAIAISGLSSTDWDDCLARVSQHGTDRALHVAVSAQYLAVANDSPDGRIQLWSNVLFQEHSSFHPGEPISIISFSSSGSMLACYCLEHTYVWKVSDGSIVATLKSPYREKAMTVVFGPEETYLIIATDLRRVHRLNLKIDNPTWYSFDESLLEETSLPEGAFINSPSSVAFNTDCTQLAVAYRGFPLAIWGLDPPEMIARCKRKRKQGHTTNVSWTGVNRVVWHPFNAQVLGIYRDGNIFKWGTVDDRHEEVKQELDATPSEIQCSPTGLVFATSDVRGSIKIYDFSQMSLVYKLTSDDIVNAITFGPDGSRFYDLRGSYCNVWEPNCLIRLTDTTSMESSEDSESMMSGDRERTSSIVSDMDDIPSSSTSISASEAHADTKPAITAVAVCPGNQQLFAYANEEGVIEICNTATDQRHIVAQSAFGMSVVQLALSRNGDYVAYSLLSGRVTVKRIDLVSNPGKVSTKVAIAEKSPVTRGAVRQLLLDHRSEHVFVCGTEKIQVLAIAGGRSIADKDVNSVEQPTQWDNHPTNADILLAFTAHEVRAYSWDGLEPKYTISLDHAFGLDGVNPPNTVIMESLLQSYNPKLQLAIISTDEANYKLFSLAILDTSVLHDSDLIPSGTIGQLPIPHHIAERIHQPVALLSDGRLVFLDEDLWVCTARLRSPPSAGFANTISRLFFIPRDWLSIAGLVLCRVQPDGTFLCPSKGEMAVITVVLGTERARHEW